MGRKPYMGFSAERGSWAWRGREASCSPKTTQSPAGPRQPSKLGRSCETCSFHPSQGWAWMEHAHTPAYAQPVCAQTSLCICAQTCVCLGIVFCGHRYMRTPRRFCVFGHTAQSCTEVCVLLLQVSSFKGMLTSDSSPTPIFPPVPGLSAL